MVLSVAEQYGSDEEAQAQAFGEFLKRDKALTPETLGERAMAKIINAIRAIWRAIRQKGLTAEMVFEGITKGELKGRTADVSMEAGNVDIKKADVDKGNVLFQVEITGEELGGYASITELRRKAREYGRKNLAGKMVRVVSTGEDIEISSGGLKHSTSSNNTEKIKSIVALPDLIKNSAKIKTQPDKRHDRNVKMVHYYSAKLKTPNGEHDIIIVVKERKDGHKYYDHYKEVAPVESGEKPKGSSNQSITDTTSDNSIQNKTAESQENNIDQVQFQVETDQQSRVDKNFQKGVEQDEKVIIKILDSLKKNGNELAADFFRDIEKTARNITSDIDKDAVKAALKEAKMLYDNRGMSKEAYNNALAAMIGVQAALDKAGWYQNNRASTLTWLQRQKNTSINVWADTKHFFDKILGVMTTRLAKISPEIKREVRAVFFRQFSRSAEMKNQVAPMLEKKDIHLS